MRAATETLEAVDIVRLLGVLITDKGLAPGDRLPSIRELAVQYGVKAGTVRDALLTAQARGLVKILPRVGGSFSRKQTRTMQLPLRHTLLMG